MCSLSLLLIPTLPGPSQTRCERLRASASTIAGAYVPQCDSEGRFLPTQCRVSTGQCWCVNAAGDEIPGTLTSPGQPRPNCAGVCVSLTHLYTHSSFSRHIWVCLTPPAPFLSPQFVL